MAESYANLKHRHSQKGRHLLSRAGYKAGGAVHDDAAQDKKMIKAEIAKAEKKEDKTELKSGGAATGMKAGGRLDRKARAAGGRTKKKGTQVNVIVAGGGQSPPHPVPVPVPVGGPPPGGPPPGAMPPPAMARPPMPPPGGPPPGMPPGMPPRPMANTGGRIARKAGGRALHQLDGRVQDRNSGGNMGDKRAAAANARGTALEDLTSWTKDTAGKMIQGVKDKWGAPASATKPDAAPTPAPTRQKEGGGDGGASDEGAGEKRGGAVRKHKARGGLTTASKVSYDGSLTSGNSIAEKPKNKQTGGSVNKPFVHMTAGAHSGVGNLEKAKLYRKANGGR